MHRALMKLRRPGRRGIVAMAIGVALVVLHVGGAWLLLAFVG